MSETPDQPGTERVHPQEPAEGRDDESVTSDPDRHAERVHPQDPAEGADDSSATG